MIIIGHRGARKEAPENTLAGFVHAQMAGCMAFELDVRLSADHQLMVIHDATLTRTTGTRARVCATDASVMNGLDARRHTAPWPWPCPVPTLRQILDATPQCMHWQFEVKTDSRIRLHDIARQLARLIDEYELGDVAAITSADRNFLRLLQQQHPQVRRGLVAEFAIPAPIRSASELGCELLCIYRRLVDRDLVDRAQAEGLHVSVWTVNDPTEMDRLAGFGIDSLITDRPTLALSRFAPA
jgi:glycerophosphoryl diester phosphodiesterase